MSRALLIIRDDTQRRRAIEWCKKVPEGTRIEFKQPQRTLEQSSLLWAMLSDIASQKTHAERKYTPDQWKVIMMHACGREVQFIPALDGTTFIPWGQSSSDLSKREMSELIDFMQAWGAMNGVTFHAPEDKNAAKR